MGYVILFGWLILLPMCAGGIFNSKKNTLSLPEQWLWGQFLLWAAFQFLAVFFIVQEKALDDILPLYLGLGIFLGVLGAVIHCIKHRHVQKTPYKSKFMWITEHKILAAVFMMLWLLQMIMLIVQAVNDGDDAYYMAIANQAQNSGIMYTANVYSFGGTILNYRYALAPFPIWIAFLARISGIHTLTIGHIILGIILVTMSYIIYAQIGKELFGVNYRKRLQMLILIAVLYIWGNTSSHTAESFLLLRSRQGKSLVSGLVFPAIICLLIKTGHLLEQKRQIEWKNFLLAAVIVLSGCIGSTLGGALIILLWGSGLFFLALGYKRFRILPVGVLSILPGMIFVVMYLLN